MPSTPRRVAVLGGNRIPFARQNTVYANASNQDMLTAALDGLVERYGLQGERLGEFAAGAVLKHSRDFNLAREVVLGSKLSPETPAYDVQQACGTGLQAAIQVANKIALGQIEVGVAGGSDTTSDAPIAVGEGLRKVLLEANRAKDIMGPAGRADQAAPAATWCRRSRRTASPAPACRWGSTPRSPRWSGASPARTRTPWPRGRTTTSPRRTSRASWPTRSRRTSATSATRTCAPTPASRSSAKLKPVFGKGEAATMTAGNSTPLSDGASTVLLASEEWAKAHDLPVLAYMTFHETAAVDYVTGHEGLLMAPAYAMPRMLERAGYSFDEFDFYEIHEAFASQVLATLKAWEDPIFCKERLGLDAPLGPSTATSSTCTARRWPRVTRSPPPAAGSSTCSPRSSPRRAAARASSRSAPPVARV